MEGAIEFALAASAEEGLVKSIGVLLIDSSEEGLLKSSA
jgi:hypothetical protein